MSRFLFEVVRDYICPRNHDCPALSTPMNGDEVVGCELLDNAMYCPKYGSMLAWAKTKEMHYMFDYEKEVDEWA